MSERPGLHVSADTGEPPGLHVSVDAAPTLGLVRPAIEAILTGHAWPDGPEAAIARAVAGAVRAASAGDAPC